MYFNLFIIERERERGKERGQQILLSVRKREKRQQMSVAFKRRRGALLC
jgi:hypothetical protein